MPGHHSRLSPSSAHRWRACAPSVRECEGLPDTAGEEAEQGTVFHHFAAIAVEFGVEPWGMVGARLTGEDGVSREFTQEMCDKMLAGLDMVWSMANFDGAILLVEQWVDTSPWLGDDEGGTSDVVILDVERKRIAVVDWKWGAGVPVHPKWNDQAIIYLLGVWNSIAREVFEKAGVGSNEVTVEIIIEQPRAPGGGGSWTVQLQTLLNEGVQIAKDAAATWDLDAPYNPGVKQCQFCAAARLNTCKARADWLANMLGDELDDAGPRIEAMDSLELVERRALTPEQRSLILLNESMIKNWLKQLYDEAMDDALKGRPVPGLKRVAGRAGARKWQDDAKAEKIVVDQLGDSAFTKKLLSPTQVEEEVGKKVYKSRFARLVTQADPSVSLVSEDDPKPALKSTEDMLDDAWGEPDETESLI